MAVGISAGLLDQAPAVRRRLGEVPQRGADAAPGGVDAGHQQQPQRAEDVLVLERLAVGIAWP